MQAVYFFQKDWVWIGRYESLTAGGLKYLPVNIDPDQVQINIWSGYAGLGTRYYFKPNVAISALYYLNQTPTSNRWPVSLGGGGHPAANHTDLLMLSLDIQF